MKRASCLILLLPVVLLHADTIVTTKGEKFENVTISRAEPDGIVVVASYGVFKIPFTDLPKELQEKYHYDPQAADKFRTQRTIEATARAQAIEAIKTKRQRELAAAAVPTPASSATTAGPRQQVEPTQAQAANLSLDAHEISSGNPFQSNWQTWWGSYDRSYAYGKRLLVTIRDLSRRTSSCDVDVYFIGRPVFDTSTRFIYDRKSFSPQFHGRLEVSGPVGAVDLHSRIQYYASLGEKYGSGADFDGWIVIGKLNGQVFGVRASSQTLLDIGRGDPRQKQSFVTMIADYEKTATR